jgi:hypothetical protein
MGQRPGTSGLMRTIMPLRMAGKLRDERAQVFSKLARVAFEQNWSKSRRSRL